MNSLEQTVQHLWDARLALDRALDSLMRASPRTDDIGTAVVKMSDLIGDARRLNNYIQHARLRAEMQTADRNDAQPIGERRISPYRLVPGNAPGMYSVMQAGHESVTIDGANCWPRDQAQQIADDLNASHREYGGLST